MKKRWAPGNFEIDSRERSGEILSDSDRLEILERNRVEYERVCATLPVTPDEEFLKGFDWEAYREEKDPD